MQTNPTPEQWALDLLADIIDIGGLGGPCSEADCVECGKVALKIQAAFAKREARLRAEMAVVQQSHDWMYGEKQRLENALKDIASRAHANLATREPEDRTHG